MKKHCILTPYINNDDNCLYSAIGNVLSWYGITIEYIDLIFQGQIDFFYSKKSDDSMLSFKFSEEFPRNFILDKYSLKERMKDLMAPYGIKVEWMESESYESSWKDICKQCDQSPLVLFMDLYYLKYRETFNNTHGSHFFTMCGYEGEDAYVLDTSKTFNYEGIIEGEFLRDGRKLDLGISEISNAWMTLDVDSNTKRDIDIECLYKVINRIIHNMLLKTPEQDKFWGVRAMDVFMEDMENLVKANDSYNDILQSDTRLNRSLENLFISLMRVAQQRNGFSNFLNSFITQGTLPDIQEFKLISDNYKLLSDNWFRIRNQFYLAHRKKDLKKVADILPSMKKIVDDERVNMERLSCVSEKLLKV